MPESENIVELETKSLSYHIFSGEMRLVMRKLSRFNASHVALLMTLTGTWDIINPLKPKSNCVGAA